MRVLVTGATGNVGRPEWTHVRPDEFIPNKLFLWGPSIRAEGVVYEPFPEVASWPVHYRRQGGFAAANADFLLGFTDYQGNRREPTSV